MGWGVGPVSSAPQVPRTRCPICGEPPVHVRLPEHARDLLDGRDPEAVVMTYRCHRRGCREVYVIRVKHFTEVA